MIYHVVSDRAVKGARVYAQSSYAECEFFIADVLTLPWSLFKVLVSEKKKTVVFHEQYSLASLLISYVLTKIFRRKHDLIYDMHDIASLEPYPKMRTKILISFYKALEYTSLRILKIPVITVSKHLSSHISKEYKVLAPVVYSVPPSVLACETSRDKRSQDMRRVLYFGLIEPTRLDVSLLEKIVNKGFKVDLYGIFSSNSDASYKEAISSLVSKSGGDFRGRYSPSDLSFIKNYAGVLMLYDTSSENVKGCLPNKLFQSMVMGVPCVVSSGMVEARNLFQKYNAVVTDVESLSESSRIDWVGVNKEIICLREESRLNFKKTAQI